MECVLLYNKLFSRSAMLSFDICKTPETHFLDYGLGTYAGYPYLA